MTRLQLQGARCSVGAGLLLWITAVTPVTSTRAAGQGGGSPAPQRVRAAERESLERVDPARMRVEAGAVVPGAGGEFTIRHPGLRAVLPGMRGSAARISFVYRGPTRDTARLASGELRRQIGLKLRARDTCNLLYVMWHIAPDAGIQVQAKSNPRQSTHAECRDHGYRTFRGTLQRPLPPIQIGERHTLEARVEGDRLRVLADGRPAWEGKLPAEVFELDGPAGIRSDNGEFEVEIWAAPELGPDEKR